MSAAALPSVERVREREAESDAGFQRTSAEARVLDRSAFQDFYDETSTPLRRYLLRVCRDPAQAEDIFQESYVRLINRSGLRRGPELRGYLFRVATNLLRDQWRKATRERHGLKQWFGTRRRGPTEPPATPEVLDLESALDELAPKDRAMLWLAHVEGYGHRQIGEMLGVKAASVRVLLFRLRKRLAERLDSGHQNPTKTSGFGGGSS